MKYETIEPISKHDAEILLARDHSETICRTLVRVAMFEPDRHWAQSECLRFATHTDAAVRGLAATCLGHLARIHKVIDEDEVMPVVRMLLKDSDSQTRAKAEDAISDFSISLGWNKRKIKKLLAA
ncbi:MAG: hypothetical protein ACRD9S_19580 [Pyrinomonadaceae bacterium]